MNLITSLVQDHDLLKEILSYPALIAVIVLCYYFYRIILKLIDKISGDK